MMNQATMRTWPLQQLHLLIINDAMRVLLLATHSLWVTSAAFGHLFRVIQSVLHVNVLADLRYIKKRKRDNLLAHQVQGMHHH